MAVTFRLLGPVVAERTGRPLDLGTVRQRALLAVLALEARHVVPLDTVVDALWGDDPPARAEVSVRAYVSNLRRVLEPDRAPRTPPALLRTSGAGYSLDVPDGDVDALAFAAAAGRAVRADQDGDWAGALAAADDGLGRWQGPALVDLQAIPFAPGATARLDGQRARVELIRLQALVELGRPAEALGGLEARVADDPLDEAATALLMRVLYLLGRPSDALACFGALSDRLAGQGLLPGPALRDLEGAVLRHDTVLDPPATPAATALARPPRPAGLVGRDAVWDALTEPGGGPPRWFVLAGEAGIGKTYLAEALADASPGAVAWGAARRDDDQPPLWLWQRALAGLGHPEPLAGEGTGIVAATVADRLRSAARQGPVLLVLDDVQWADATSLTVLGLVAAELRRGDLTAVLTVRPSPEPALVDAALAEVLRQGGARRIDLQPLDVTATRALAATVDVVLPDEAAVVLRDTAGGNPLLMRELLRLGPVAKGGGRLPDSIAALVASRLDPLPGPTTEVLGLAALAGDDIDVELLAGAVDVPARGVVEWLRPAVRGALVVDDPLRFRHATLRDVVLAGLDPAARRSGHARIAAAMAGSPRWPAARRVHHLAAARPVVAVEELVDAVRHAAGDAAAVGAFAEQARLLEVALADGALAGGDRLALTVDAAEARVRAGQDVDAQRLVAEALDLAGARGDTAAAGRAAQALARGGGAWYWVPFGQHPGELLARLHRAAAAAEAFGDRAAQASILAAAAVGESYGPDPARPGRLAVDALRVARSQPEPAARAEALVAASWAGFGTAPPAELLDLAAELAGLAADLPPERQALAHAFRLAASLRLGRLDAAAESLAAGETAARAHRLPAFEATFAWGRATLLAAQGRLAAGDEAAAAAFEQHQRTQVYAADLARWLVALHGAEQRGDMAEAVAFADQLAAVDDHGFLYQARAAVAGGVDVDRDALAPRLAAVLDEPPSWHRITRLRVVGLLVADLGLTDLVPDTERALAPFAREQVVLGTALACGGPVRLVLARLALAGGRPEEAAARCEAALAEAEATGLGGWIAPVALALAEARHAAGDGVAAAAAAQQAMDVARRLGQAGVVDAAARLRRPLRAIAGGRRAAAGQARRPRIARADP
ncbi:MAG TPA: BTAD domain-containing putative transcriptional regulator [Acidimicrobiales bacterium]|jgi:DNA-binding SARP family transcriptional activator